MTERKPAMPSRPILAMKPGEYRSAAQTDLQATFARIRAEQAKPANVRQLSQPRRAK